MKYPLLFNFFCLLTTLSFAQPTITSSDLLKVGDVVITQPCATTTFAPGSAGANRSWDFSQLIAEGPEDSTFYISPVGTPYASSFPESNIVGLFGGNQYGYYQVTGDELHFWGQKDPSNSLVLTNPAVYFKSPTTFGTYIVDSIAGSLSSGPLNGTLIGQVFYQGDGYGTLSTPGGNYNDVLRVKTLTVAVATVGFFGTITDSVYNYSWYKLGIESPVLEMIEDTQWLNGAIISRVRYVNYLRSISSPSTAVHAAQEDKIKVYPNPASDAVRFSGLTAPTRITLHNSTGQKVLDTTIHANDALPLSTLKSGIYFCSIYTNTQQPQSTKICIQ